MPDITSANAVFIISVPLLLPVPQQLVGFAADDIFDVSDVDATETMMGVDGILSGGMVFAPKPMNIALQADSPSGPEFFDAWYAGMQGALVAFSAQATVTFPGLQKSYDLFTGYLKRYKPMPDAKKVLQPRRFGIEWQSIVSAPVGITG